MQVKSELKNCYTAMTYAPGIEEALSRDRMDSLWTKYTTDFRQRKIGDCKELHIATRWSVHDVLGRLEREYDEKVRFTFSCRGKKEKAISITAITLGLQQSFTKTWKEC